MARLSFNHAVALTRSMLDESARQSLGLEQFRMRGLRLVALIGWVWTALFSLLALGQPLNHPVTAIAYSALLNVTPSLSARARHYDFRTFLPAALTASLQPAVLLYLLQGNAWQAEGHLFFFAGVASLTLLCDWRPLAVAAGAIAVHNMLFGYLMPSWLFVEGWTLSRATTHVAAVAMMVLLSSQMAVLTRRLIDQQDDAADANAKAAVDAIAARRLAEGSLAAVTRAEAEAATERTARAAAEDEAQHARSTALATLGRDYEQSVAAIAAAVSAAAVQLEVSARDMSRIARTTGDEADAVMSEATTASRAAGQVSSAVSALSRSIAAVADASEQQSRLGDAARAQTAEGEDMLRALAERTAGIGSFVELIKGVATQTGMLALNATIEAARAGEAGRGFAVVAGEVKNLAIKAESASEDVTRLVTGIGERTSRADRALAAVAGAMGGLIDHARLVEQEIAAQRRTAELIVQTAADSAGGVESMAGRCAAVAEAARAATRLSAEVQQAAAQLAEIAHTLQGATGKLVADMRAA